MRQETCSRKREDFRGHTSVRFSRRAVIFSRNLNADQSALQRYRSAIPIYAGVTAGQALFCPSFRSFRAGHVNFGGAFSRLGEHGDAIAQNFGKAVIDRDAADGLRVRPTVRQLSDTQFRNQRGVSR